MRQTDRQMETVTWFMHCKRATASHWFQFVSSFLLPGCPIQKAEVSPFQHLWDHGWCHLWASVHINLLHIKRQGPLPLYDQGFCFCGISECFIFCQCVWVKSDVFSWMVVLRSQIKNDSLFNSKHFLKRWSVCRELYLLLLFVLFFSLRTSTWHCWTLSCVSPVRMPWSTRKSL